MKLLNNNELQNNIELLVHIYIGFSKSCLFTISCYYNLQAPVGTFLEGRLFGYFIYLQVRLGASLPPVNAV